MQLQFAIVEKLDSEIPLSVVFLSPGVHSEPILNSALMEVIFTDGGKTSVQLNPTFPEP